MNRKEQLIKEIQTLLNTHENVTTTSINPSLLEFMDENTLLSIIGSLLDQKEAFQSVDTEWLEQFKCDKN